MEVCTCIRIRAAIGTPNDLTRTAKKGEGGTMEHRDQTWKTMESEQGAREERGDGGRGEGKVGGDAGSQTRPDQNGDGEQGRRVT